MSGRFQRPPGGATSHNLFSWNDNNESDSGSVKPSSSHTSGQEENSYPHTSSRGTSRASANQLGSQIFFGEIVEEEQQPRSRNRPGSARKLEELSGSGIFSSAPANNEPPPVDRPSVRLHQPAGGASQIMLGTDHESTPKKVMSPRKKMELSGTPNSDDRSLRKQFSAAKIKELHGSLSLFPTTQDSVKYRIDTAFSTPTGDGKPTRISKPVGGASSIVFGEVEPEIYQSRASDQKIRDLLGTGEYKEESPTLPVSDAKRRELRGCDIFADEQPQFRDSLAGIRQPPGGDSSIALV